MVEKLNFFPGLIILPFWQQVSIHNSYTDESLPTLMKWAPSCCNFKGIIVFFSSCAVDYVVWFPPHLSTLKL